MTVLKVYERAFPHRSKTYLNQVKIDEVEEERQEVEDTTNEDNLVTAPANKALSYHHFNNRKMTVLKVYERAFPHRSKSSVNQVKIDEVEEERQEVEDTTNEDNLVTPPANKALRKKGFWYAVDEDFLPGAKFCPEAITEYYCGNKMPENACKLRMHLLFMGWKIESKEDQNRHVVHYRYISPDGSYYFSLNMVVKFLMHQDGEDQIETVHKMRVVDFEVPDKQFPSLKCQQESIGSTFGSGLTIKRIGFPAIMTFDEQPYRRKRSLSCRGRRLRDHSSDQQVPSPINLEESIGTKSHTGSSMDKFPFPMLEFFYKERPRRKRSLVCRRKRILDHSSDKQVPSLISLEEGIGTKDRTGSIMDKFPIPMLGIFYKGRARRKRSLVCRRKRIPDHSRDMVVKPCIERKTSLASFSEASVSFLGIVEEERGIVNHQAPAARREHALKHFGSAVEEQIVETNCSFPVANVDKFSNPSLGIEVQEGGSNHSPSYRIQGLLGHYSNVIESVGGTECNYFVAEVNEMSVPLPGFDEEAKGVEVNNSPRDRSKLILDCCDVIGEHANDSKHTISFSKMAVPLPGIVVEENNGGNSSQSSIQAQAPDCGTGISQEDRSIEVNCSIVSRSKISAPLLGNEDKKGVGSNYSLPGVGNETLEFSSEVIQEARCIENSSFPSAACISEMSVPLLTCTENQSNANAYSPCANIGLASEHSGDLVEQFAESNCSSILSAREMPLLLPYTIDKGQSFGNHSSPGKRICVSDYLRVVAKEKEGIDANCSAANEVLVPLRGIFGEDQGIGNDCSLSEEKILELEHSGCFLNKEQGIENVHSPSFTDLTKIQVPLHDIVDKEGFNKKRGLKCSGLVPIRPEYYPQAVIDYCKLKHENGNFILDDSNVTITQLRLKVKMHLSAEGWLFWYVSRQGKRELRYCSPKRKIYNSLMTACMAWMENTMIMDVSEGQPSSNSFESNQSSAILFNRSKEDSIDLIPSQRSLQCSSSSCLVEKVTTVDELSVSTSYKTKQRPLKHHSIDSQKLDKFKVSRALFKQGSRSDGSHMQHVVKLRKRALHQHKSILPLLIAHDVVSLGQKVHYKQKKVNGKITHDGIECDCCGNVYGISNFEVHAGSNIRRPAANILLEDGRSLADCQLQLKEFKDIKQVPLEKIKSDGSFIQGNNICSVCHDGGELVLCVHCPSGFHSSCIGSEDVPEGEWFCPSCRCGICGKGEFIWDSENFTEKTVIYCDQCECEYHVGCLREREIAELMRCPEGNWFCSENCSQIFVHLHELVGRPNPTSLEGLTWTILRSEKEKYHSNNTSNDTSIAEHHEKLLIAYQVLLECFSPIVEPLTKRELIKDILFNKQSDLNRVNFEGFYTMLLERGNEMISVATIRIYGEKVAEMPLIGTRLKYRQQGMCRLLMNELEKMLFGLGVKRLLLPSIPSLLNLWTISFGFTKMTRSEKVQFIQHPLLEFQETATCHKLLTTYRTKELESKATLDLC